MNIIKELNEVCKTNRHLIELNSQKKIGADRKPKEVTRQKNKKNGFVLFSTINSIIFLIAMVVNLVFAMQSESNSIKLVHFKSDAD